MRLIDRLRTALKPQQFTAPPYLSDMSDSTDEKILQFMCPCRACGKEVVKRGDGHSYTLLASEIAHEESQDLKQFFRLYNSRRWADLNQIKRFEGAFNAALLYAVQCTGGITLLLVRSPVELFEDDSLLDAVVLDEAEVSAINMLHLTFKSL
ncbi:MAG: hypothetical protein WCA10_22225 [Terracidiphilus sp.]